MFGANPIRKQELRPDGQLWVQEVFRTIQGEGPLAGRPAVFIRLSGCNLACKFCDTEFESGQMVHWLAVSKQASELARGWLRPLFVISGGEPFRQDIRLLVLDLLSYDFPDGTEVQIETAGTLWLEDLHPSAQIVVSPKTGKLHPMIVQRACAWKYILRAGEVDVTDGLPDIMPTGVSGRVARPPRGAQVFVQPCDDHDPQRNAANLRVTKEVALALGYRLSLQQHKILELP